MDSQTTGPVVRSHLRFMFIPTLWEGFGKERDRLIPLELHFLYTPVSCKNLVLSGDRGFSTHEMWGCWWCKVLTWRLETGAMRGCLWREQHLPEANWLFIPLISDWLGYRGVTGEILIAQSVGLWTVIEVSSSTIWYLHMKLVLRSTLGILHFICREAVWARTVSGAYFIILQRCCQTASLARSLVSFQTENRKWQDGVQRGGTTHLTTGGRDCNKRNVNVSIFTFTAAPGRKSSSWDTGWHCIYIYTYRKLTRCKALNVTNRWKRPNNQTKYGHNTKY